MSRYLLLTIIVSFLSCYCTEDKTEMVLNIYSDFLIPSEMDRVELRLFRADTEIIRKEYKIESENELPVKILLTQENNVEELLGIRVKAKRDNTIVSEVFVERAFIRHQRVIVDIYIKKDGSKIEDAGVDDAGVDTSDIMSDIYDISEVSDYFDAGFDGVTDSIDSSSDSDIIEDIVEIGGEIGCASGCGGNATCINDKCKCNTGFENCNNDWSDGCEADIMNNIKYCGGCNASCNVLNVENVRCSTGKCDYDICKLGYEDADKDRTNGCEKFNFFPKVYGGSGDEMMEDMRITSDGGIIIVATTSTCCFGDKDIWVVRLNKNGDILWQKVIGRGKEEKGPFKIYELNSGDFIIVGSTMSLSSTESKGLIIKLDKDGNLLSTKSLSGPDWSGFKDIYCNNDLDCTIIGSAAIMGDTGHDLYEMKLDNNFSIMSQRLFRIKSDQGDDLFILRGGLNFNYIFTSKDGSNKGSIMILMLDSNNDIYSAKELFGDIGTRIINCIQVSGNGMYCSGYTDNTGPNKTDIFLFQYLYNNKGSIGWQKLIGDIDMDIASISDASSETTLLLAGTSIKDGLYRAVFINMDSGGNLRYLRSFQGTNGEGGFYLKLLKNNLFVIGGMSYSYGTGGAELILIPVNIRGENISECHLQNEEDIQLGTSNSNFSLRDVNIDEILTTDFFLQEVVFNSTNKIDYRAGSICEK
ncbi:MAG: hypothetical protein ACP5KG_03360 [Myxococcota bacterium]